ENAKTVTDTIWPGQILRVPAPSTLEDQARNLNLTEQRRKASQSFIDQYGSTFKRAIGDSLPLDAVMAQAMRESAFGTSELFINAHNPFGIKARADWSGE